MIDHEEHEFTCHLPHANEPILTSKRHSTQVLLAFNLWDSLVCFQKIKDGCMSKSDQHVLPSPQNVLEPPLLHFFFSKEVHHPMRNEKLGNVPDVGDPNLNIEWPALQ